jgi:hypothetical protein
MRKIHVVKHLNTCHVALTAQHVENKQAIEILGEEGFGVYTSSGELKYLDFMR